MPHSKYIHTSSKHIHRRTCQKVVIRQTLNKNYPSAMNSSGAEECHTQSTYTLHHIHRHICQPNATRRACSRATTRHRAAVELRKEYKPAHTLHHIRRRTCQPNATRRACSRATTRHRAAAELIKEYKPAHTLHHIRRRTCQPKATRRACSRATTRHRAAVELRNAAHEIMLPGTTTARS